MPTGGLIMMGAVGWLAGVGGICFDTKGGSK